MSISPGWQLIDPVDLVVGDAANDISQPGLRFNTVELGGLNQPLKDSGSGFTAIASPRGGSDSPTRSSHTANAELIFEVNHLMGADLLHSAITVAVLGHLK